jgi:hypothetical protein
MTRRLAVLLLPLSIACSRRPPAAAADSSTAPAPAVVATDSAPAPVITLERKPCFGTCPVYRLSIWSSGTVEFIGERHVTQQGRATASIPPARVDSLVAELEAGGYFGFEERYVHGEPACGLYATDSPTVVTSLTLDGRAREIHHDYGCSAAPPELGRLERRIDEVAGSSRWTGR